MYGRTFHAPSTIYHLLLSAITITITITISYTTFRVLYITTTTITITSILRLQEVSKRPLQHEDCSGRFVDSNA